MQYNLVGGKSKGKTLADVAKLHGMTAKELTPQFKKGTQHELEHTNNLIVARKIALDHLVEFPDYYDRLDKIEKMKKGAVVETPAKLNDIVLYHEKKGNWLFAKGNFYAWLYDEDGVGKKIESGEYDFIMFPPMGKGSPFSDKYVPPLLMVWNKPYQKKFKGAEHLIGIVQGFYDEDKNEIFIDMMTTNPKYRRQGINAHLIKSVREALGVPKENVTFDKPTKEGTKFMQSGKFEKGGEIDETAQMYIDIISMNPNLEKYQKYKEILKNEYDIDFDAIYKDQEYIETANLQDIKLQNDFLDFDNWIAYAKKISKMRGFVRMDDYMMAFKYDVTDDVWKKMSALLDFRIEKVEYIETTGSGDIARVMGNTIYYTEHADLYYLLHEIGHIYDFQNNVNGIIHNPAYSPTHYGTMNGGETFAENFAIYFINPTALRNWNEKVYDEMEKTINAKYEVELTSLVSEYLSDGIDKMHLGGDMSKHLAPNGKPSNLTHEQWHLVRTPEFKAWFGDWENDPKNASKVVDENGEPLVVHHGTIVETNFDIFDYQKADLGFHFGTKEQAKNRVESKGVLPKRKSIVNSFFLNIRVLFEMSDAGEWQYPQRYIDELISDNIIEEKVAKQKGFLSLYSREDNAIIRDYIKSKYGSSVGFVYNNKYEGKGKSFIALSPNEIKLADGTNTTFDGNNPDIRFAKGGEIENLIDQGEIELKVYPTTPKHANLYGLKSENPLYIQTIFISENQRLKGIGKKVLKYLNDFAIENGHDVMFGHITQKASFSKDDSRESNLDDVAMIKNWLQSNGYEICEGNNDFYKVVNNPDIRFAKGGTLDFLSSKSLSIKIDNDIYKIQYQKDELGSESNPSEKKVWFAKVISKNGKRVEGRLCYADDYVAVIYGFNLDEIKDGIMHYYQSNDLYLILQDELGKVIETRHIENDNSDIMFAKGGENLTNKELMASDLVNEQKQLQRNSKYAILLDATWSNYTNEMREVNRNLEDEVIKKLGYNPLVNYYPFSDKVILMFDDNSNLIGALEFTIKPKYTQVPRYSPDYVKPEPIFENNNNVFFIEYLFSFAKGNGQKIMNKLKQYAHKYNVDIGLYGSIVYREDQEKPMASAKHLRRFYDKQGFVNVKGHYFLYSPNSMAKGGELNTENKIYEITSHYFGRLRGSFSGGYYYYNGVQLRIKDHLANWNNFYEYNLKNMMEKFNPYYLSVVIDSTNSYKDQEKGEINAEKFVVEYLEEYPNIKANEIVFGESDSVEDIIFTIDRYLKMYNSMAKGGRTIAQTPAPASDRKYGSKTNPKGSASDSQLAKSIKFNNNLEKAIENKVEAYNEKHRKDEVGLSTAKAVVRRGMGAYSKSHRPTISGGAPNSRQAWGLARLNKFLLKKSGEKVKSAYIQDDDLLKYAKGGKLNSGDCYEVAGRMALMDVSKAPNGELFLGNPKVVHGEVAGQGSLKGIRYGHAWVEDDVYVYDFSNGRELVISKDVYYYLGKIKQEKPKLFKYTFKEAIDKMVESRNFGPWDLITDYADGGQLESEIKANAYLVPSNCTDISDVDYALDSLRELDAKYGSDNPKLLKLWAKMLERKKYLESNNS
jgi:GNAT superfamily N-acetyltransferase